MSIGQTETTKQIELSKALYDEISRDFKICNRTRRVDLPEFATLKWSKRECQVEFSIGWYDVFIVTFRPKTIGVKYTKTNSAEKTHETVSKQFPLEQADLLDNILTMYTNVK